MHLFRTLAGTPPGRVGRGGRALIRGGGAREMKTAFQDLVIFRNRLFGRVLALDGVVQTTEADEFIYHEMIVHVPIFVHPSPERVLVIGGGDGGTVREALRHPGVRRIVMVEIDEMVVTAARTHLPTLSVGLDDPRVDLKIADGVKFVAETKERFDVVIVDSTDPVGPAAPLFDREFYENVSRILDADGILITQAESPFYNPEIQRPMLMNQRPFFKHLHVYLFSNLTYPGGLWSFGFASKTLCPIQDFKPERIAASGLCFHYYNAGIHQGAFMLPNFMRQNLDGIIDDLPIPTCR